MASFNGEPVGGETAKIYNQFHGSKKTAPENGYGSKLRANLKSTFGNKVVKGAMYIFDSSGVMNLLANSLTEAITITTGTAWYDLPFINTPSFTKDTVYIPVMWGRDNYSYLTYSSGEYKEGWYHSLTYNSFPDPCDFNGYYASRHYDIEVHYTTEPPAGWKKLQYFSEPPTGGAFNKLKFASEPPVSEAWNKLLYEGE